MTVPSRRNLLDGACAALLLSCVAASAADTVSISPDDPSSIRRAIETASQAGSGRVVIPPGIYRLPGPDAPPGQPGWHLFLEDIHDLTIDATGVTFISTDRRHPAIRFRHCRNVVFQGATLLRAVPAGSQGTIVALSPQANTVDIRVDKGYPDDLDDPVSFPHFWTNVFDPDTRRWLTHLRSPSSSPQRVGDLWRAKTEDLGALGIALSPGMRVAWRGEVYDDLSISECAGMRIVGVTVRGGAGMCFHEMGGEGGNVYADCKATYGDIPPGGDQPPLLASNADGFHSSEARKGPTLTRCSFEGLDDDAIAIHGFYGLVVEAAKSRIVIGRQRAGKDPLFAHPGDLIRFCDPRGIAGGEARVISTTALPDYHPASPPDPRYRAFQDSKDVTYVECLLDAEVPARSSWLAANQNECGAGYVVRDCTIRKCFARGILPKAPDGLIEGCIIEETSRGAIELLPELTWWSEADYSRNVVIRRNTIRNVSLNRHDGPLRQPGALTIFSFPDGAYALLPGGHRNIVIEDNLFDADDGVNILISSAQDVTIRGNRFEAPMRHPTDFGKTKGVDAGALIWLTQCRGVNLESNTVSGAGEGLKRTIGTSDSAEGSGFDAGVLKKADKGGIESIPPLVTPSPPVLAPTPSSRLPAAPRSR